MNLNETPWQNTELKRTRCTALPKKAENDSMKPNTQRSGTSVPVSLQTK